MIDYISPSQINCFLDEPALWIVQYLYGVKGEAGAGAWRGSAIEAALDHVLFKTAPSPDVVADYPDEISWLVDIALRRFELDAGGEVAPDKDKERDAIPLYLSNLLPFVRAKNWDLPNARQLKIETYIEDAKILGFIDYKWDGWFVDLKTTSRMPSFDGPLLKGKDEHIRQVAIYKEATGCKPFLLYATPGKQKEPILYEVSDQECELAMRQVRAAIRAIKQLDQSKIELFPPRDLTGYRWDEPTRSKAMELWRL